TALRPETARAPRSGDRARRASAAASICRRRTRPRAPPARPRGSRPRRHEAHVRARGRYGTRARVRRRRATRQARRRGAHSLVHSSLPSGHLRRAPVPDGRRKKLPLIHSSLPSGRLRRASGARRSAKETSAHSFFFAVRAPAQSLRCPTVGERNFRSFILLCRPGACAEPPVPDDRRKKLPLIHSSLPSGRLRRASGARRSAKETSAHSFFFAVGAPAQSLRRPTVGERNFRSFILLCRRGACAELRCPTVGERNFRSFILLCRRGACAEPPAPD